MNKAIVKRSAVGMVAVAMGLVLFGCGFGAAKKAGQASGEFVAESPGTAAKAQAFYSGVGSPDSTLPTLPNPALTPGDTLAVTASDICQPGYAHAVRNVPSDVKRQVYESYGILHHTRGEFEVDHLISLELGGSNSVKNLWPESYQTQPWNARVKDQLEDRLHDDVCSQQMDLAAAQQAISGNWIDTYKREFHTQTPLTTTQYGKRSGARRHRGDELVRAADETPDTNSGSAEESAPEYSSVAYPNAAAISPVPIALTPPAGSAPQAASSNGGGASQSKVLGEYSLPQIFLSHFPLLWQNQAGPIHDRIPSSGRRIYSGQVITADLNHMAANHKLTGVLQGRVIETVAPQESLLTVTFDDGLVMTVKTGGAAGGAALGKTVQGVRQKDLTLDLDFSDQSSWQITLAEATSSVMVRDKNHAMVYAD